MQRTKCKNAVAAAAVIAAVVAGAGGAACLCIGCHTSPSAGGEPAAAASAAVATSARSVEAVKVHTSIAQELVEQAIPNSNPVGQAQLSAAGLEHQAVLSSADQTAVSLSQLRESIGRSAEELAAVKNQLVDQQQQQRKLERQWYVVWGLRVEKAFWTAAALWLGGTVVSLLLGLGNPIGWFTRLRGILSARQSWLGEAFVK